MSWHHIVMNHSSTADGGCVQQPAVLLTAETHSSEDTVWSHLSTTVSDNMSASWTRCTAHRINLFSCDSLLFSQRCCQFLLSRWSRGWPRSQNNVLIMFYKSYKYEFQECKWMIYIYIKEIKIGLRSWLNASFTPVRLISELAGNIMWLNYLCDAWHLLNKMQNTLSASVAMLPLVLSEGWCGNFGQAIK